jgi:hypothetical protein
MAGLALMFALQVAASPAVAVDEKPVKDADKMVCKADKDTRSRITSARICKTRAEWAEDAREVQKIVKDASARNRRN